MNGETTAPGNKPIAALTYLFGLITGLVFLNVEPYNRDDFVRFHARQSIVFSVAMYRLVGDPVGLYRDTCPAVSAACWPSLAV